MESSPHLSKRRRQRGEDRVVSACNLCKQRKVKCDGNSPCSYCTSKSRATSCTFSNPNPRQRVRQGPPHHDTAGAPPAFFPLSRPADGPATPVNGLAESGDQDDRQDTAVPLDARLLRDDQGKVIFIGDCAPLSFLQTIRHLVAAKVGPKEISGPLSRDSIIEVPSKPMDTSHLCRDYPFDAEPNGDVITGFERATCGLIDLFDMRTFSRELHEWALLDEASKLSENHATRLPLFYLVTAIYCQNESLGQADAYFQEAKRILMSKLCSDNSMLLETVQGFALLTVYMLMACQPNAAYVHFGLAARCGYAIGLHRTEVNASFREGLPMVRDKTWKSLRVVDMLISHLLGRPTCTADIDCTVVYDTEPESRGLGLARDAYLDANLQMFLILDRIVMEVYSRKRISLRIASYITLQFKTWASRWLHRLTLAASGQAYSPPSVTGACHCLCSYYHGIMLLTRPFLVHQLYEFLGTATRPQETQVEHHQGTQYASAALEAAVSFVDILRVAMSIRSFPAKMPMIVPWLFTTSLVLAIGVLGHNGLVYENECYDAIDCIDEFAKRDAHARNYAEIARTLLETTKKHVREREKYLRRERRRTSGKMFGFDASDSSMPQEHSSAEFSEPDLVPFRPERMMRPMSEHQPALTLDDNDLFALPWLDENDPVLQDFLEPERHRYSAAFANIPLFLLDQNSSPPADAEPLRGA